MKSYLKFYFCISLIITVSFCSLHPTFAYESLNKSTNSILSCCLKDHIKAFLQRVWIYNKYNEAKKHKATFDFDTLMDLSEEVLNKPLRQGFDRNVYSSALMGPILITEMTDDEILKALGYEFNNWFFHMDYKLNPPKAWHIIIDARPYLNDVDDRATVVFYLLNPLHCDTNPCSICGDGSRYWCLKNEAIKRNLKV